jgi:hypothetical protein
MPAKRDVASGIIQIVFKYRHCFFGQFEGLSLYKSHKKLNSDNPLISKVTLFPIARLP